LPLIARVPIGLNRRFKVIAVIAPATIIKLYVWIGRVHDAM
jgi:hypothetical protein